MKFSQHLARWLKDSNFSTCFFVAGGNNMHLLNSFRGAFNCIPVIHEVTAAIASEYFNQHSETGRSFVLLTAGPGLTNAITGIAGAWLDSRPLLVIGGQVKSTDLADNGLRQRGIQEIGGVEIVKSITKAAVVLRGPISHSEFKKLVQEIDGPRPGPVFIEICLDAQGAEVEADPVIGISQIKNLDVPITLSSSTQDLKTVAALFNSSKRPVLLLGGGVPRPWARENQELLDDLNIPIQLTWNGADRYGSERPLWFGRPDTWGMRFANQIIQQSDLLIAVGARLGLQQTGFNWKEFVPHGNVVHVCNDLAELEKGHPKTAVKLNLDAVEFLNWLASLPTNIRPEWLSYCKKLKNLLPLSEACNSFHPGFLNPFQFVLALSDLCTPEDRIVPCSSGGANTVMMQTFLNKTGQVFFNNRALASMGYGLAGAIGAAVASPNSRIVLTEGDGGFAQNLQDLGTLEIRNLNVKVFLFENDGYASIRMTQRNHFNGAYVGCDRSTGLGFPEWTQLARSFGIPSLVLDSGFGESTDFLHLWDSYGPAVFRVPVHPEQTYYPKITSQVLSDGSMMSAPLHRMSPNLDKSVSALVTKFL